MSKINAFDYFLIYFKDSREFIDKLSNYNEEALEAVEQLIKSNKLSFETEKESIYEKIWNLIRSDIASDRLEWIFEALLTQQRFEAVKFWISWSLGQNNLDENLESALRIITVSTNVFISSKTNEVFFEDLSTTLAEILYQGSSLYSNIL